MGLGEKVDAKIVQDNSCRATVHWPCFFCACYFLSVGYILMSFVTVLVSFRIVIYQVVSHHEYVVEQLKRLADLCGTTSCYSLDVLVTHYLS